MVIHANHRHRIINDGAAILFTLIALLAVMTCFPFIQEVSAQMDNSSTPTNITSAAQMTKSSTPINVTAVAINASKSIEEDLNSTRQAILTGNIQEALNSLEQASQIAQSLPQCVTATFVENDTGLVPTYPQQQEGMNQSSLH
jgi:hypothetical protein